MKSGFFVASSFAMLLSVSSAWAGPDADPNAEAEAYMQTWEERGRDACEDNERGCAAAGHALDRAAAAYEKAGKLDKAMAIRKMILDPKWHLDYTDYGRLATFALARNYQSIAEFEESARIVEMAVRRFPKTEEAPGALMDAVMFRLALGQFDLATLDFETFQKTYGGKRPQDVCALTLAMATAYSKQEQLDDAVKLLEKQLSLIDRKGTLGQKLRSHALLGRIHAQKGDMKKAAAHYDIVREGWKNPEQSVRTFYEGTDGTRDEQDRRLGSALMAVGEARFFFADQKRAELDAIRFPEFKGSVDRDILVKFVATNVGEWLKKKQLAIEETENAYRSIVEIQPVPPPQWVIAAASRVGFMWASFVDDLRHAPIPKEWNSNAPLAGTKIPGTEVKRLYLEQLASASEPFLMRAKSAFEVCAGLTVKFQYADEYSQSCVDWLGKNHRQKWPPIEEFHPTHPRFSWVIPPALMVPKP